MIQTETYYFVKVGYYYLSSMPSDRRVGVDYITMHDGEPSLVPNVALAFMYPKALAEDYVAFFESLFDHVRIVQSETEFTRIGNLN